MNTGGTPAAPPCLVLSISNPSLDGGYPVRWMSCVVERDWAGRHSSSHLHTIRGHVR